MNIEGALEITKIQGPAAAASGVFESYSGGGMLYLHTTERDGKYYLGAGDVEVQVGSRFAVKIFLPHTPSPFENKE